MCKAWCDVDFTFDIAVVTSTVKIFSGLYLGNQNVQKVVSNGRDSDYG